eukprot:jgi/Tetstr1/437901/TSEL_026531.t1
MVLGNKVYWEREWWEALPNSDPGALESVLEEWVVRGHASVLTPTHVTLNAGHAMRAGDSEFDAVYRLYLYPARVMNIREMAGSCSGISEKAMAEGEAKRKEKMWRQTSRKLHVIVLKVTTTLQ